MTGKQIAGFGEVLFDVLPTERRCGGAPANVIYHVNRLGGQSCVISAVGRDDLGDEAIGFLESKKIDCRFIQRNALPTSTVTVTLHNGIPDYTIHSPVAWDDIRTNREILDAASHDFAAFVFGSLAQRCETTRNSLHQILAVLPSDCLKVFDINLRQNFYSREIIDFSLQASDILKLNDEECDVLTEMFGLPSGQEEAVAALLKQFNLKYVILTLGANGSAIYDGSAPMKYYPVSPCPKIEDTVGCGDSFLAAWLLDVLAGKSLDHAMMHASEVSAYVAGCKGAMPA